MPLRKTDFDAIRRFEDGDDWLDLRVGGLSKGEGDRLRDLTAAFKIDPSSMGADGESGVRLEVDQRTAQANRALFEILCVAWSQSGEPTGEAYSELDEESGRWVDDCIEQVLRERRERAEGNARSSTKPRKRGSSSRAAAA